MAITPSLEEGAANVVPGEEPGFTTLVRGHQAMVYGLARYAVGNAADAEDIAQEVFLSLYRHRDQIRSQAHLRFWLRQVTARKCLDFRRRWRRWDELPEIACGSGASSEPWLAAKLRRWIGELPMRARLVMILRYHEDLEPEEISQLLHMPSATVKSHLRRSLDRLRRKVAHART